MGKTKVIELTKEQRLALESGYRNGTSHAFRQRCQMVLLKSEKRSSVAITRILGGCEMSINNWLRRYEAEGIAGLKTRVGRGRPSILQPESDLAQVKEAVKKSRQRLSLAKAELEQSLEKRFSTTTLKRFLKKTIAASNALEND